MKHERKIKFWRDTESGLGDIEITCIVTKHCFGNAAPEYDVDLDDYSDHFDPKTAPKHVLKEIDEDAIERFERLLQREDEDARDSYYQAKCDEMKGK